MRIFTFIKIWFSFLLLFLAFKSQAITIVSVKDGNWSALTTWSPQQIPTSSDIVWIKSEHSVTVDINATCSMLMVGESNKDNTDLLINPGIFLNVMGPVEIYGNNVDSNPTIFNVGDGTLNVGSSITFYASPGYANLEIANGTVNVSGNLDFNASGQGNIKRRSVDNMGAINLGGKVIGTGSIEGNPPAINVAVLSNDFYRSKTSGNWSIENNWQTSRDGSSGWITATKIPTASARRIEILPNHNIFLSTPSPATNLIVYGSLECKEHAIVGPGPFTLAPNATLITSNSKGISSLTTLGSIQVEGLKTYSSNANYTYRGASDQLTGDGLPGILNGILTIDKTALTSTVKVSHPILITNLVNVLQGELIADDNLTLESKIGSYGQIGVINTIIAKVSGNVNVQSFLSGSPSSLTNRGNRMISFPVKDDYSKTLYQQLKEKIVITGPKTPFVGTAEGFDLGGWAQPYAVTLTTYSEPASPIASFIPVSTIKTKAEAGKTTFVFFRGSRVNATANKVNTPYGFPEDVTANYKGTINQGDIQTSVVNSKITGDNNNGINAIGNPYPAAINWDAVWTENQGLLEVNEIRINKAGGGFVTRKVISNVPTAVNAGETMASQYIQPGQGFYVKSLNSGELTFKESHKTVSQAAPRLLTIPSITLLATNLNDGKVKDIIQKNKFLRINIQQNDLKDETLILFKDGLSSKFDDSDAIYFAGNSVLIGSLSSDGQVTSINAMPDVKDIQELKLYVNANASGAAKLSFTDLSAGEDYQIFLKDVLSPGKLIDLKQQSVYEFSIDRANPASYGTNRFTVIFKPELVAAPVFTAQKVKSNVQLNWKTVVATKVKYFEVEVSNDNILFRNIGLVENAGIQNDIKFSFVDKAPITTVRYYRLKQFNTNGSITITDPQMIDLSGNAFEAMMNITIYPNPSAEVIQVQYSGNVQPEIDAAIYSIQGNKIKGSSFRSDQIIKFDVSRLVQGVYFLELKEKGTSKVIAHSKFIVGL